MSESQTNDLLLDQYNIGSPISEHHGVRSCPAMQKDSDNKYIVKIISIPASQRNLDALLLAGAFPSPEAARGYFEELADGIVKEAEVLQQLSKLEGFLPYKHWQITSMEKGTGFEVHLVSDYRRSLERHFRKEPMTHLGAVNLGLDLCAALAVCRRCGYLYVDLKPANVFVGDDHEYRIGDLGFVPLDSLQYASLPDRYRSAYTAPEITDAYCALNTTLDIYAAGLILYQAYNNDVLPFADVAPSEPLPAPLYADYEMAQIILKACDPDPAARWEDPLQMGKAIVSYMQRNSVNDVPIVPPASPESPVAAEEEFDDRDPEDEQMADDSVEEAVSIEALLEDTPEAVSEDIFDQSAPVDAEESNTGTAVSVAELLDQDHSESADMQEADEAAEETEFSAEEPLPEERLDETLPSEESAAGLDDTALTDEVSAILALADELIAHDPPEPVVVPEPADLVVPPLQEPVDDSAPEESQALPQEADEHAEELSAEPVEATVKQEETEPDEEIEQQAKPPRSFKGLIIALLIIALALSLFTGGYAFYKFYYLQTIDSISLVNHDEQITVVLDSDIDDALLTVICKDTYGNTLRREVTNGKAVFDSLNPDTSYKFSVEISGLHKLTGKKEASFTTAEQTSVLNLSVIGGSEDGSAILSFTVQGPDSSWQVICSAEGESDKTFSCTDHTATLQGLTPGVTYKIRLVPAATLYVVGEDSLEYTATSVILAQEPTVESFLNNQLVIAWTAPEGAAVNSWTVRCYDNSGFDQTVTVSETKATFADMDPANAYNIDITAEGMIKSVTVSVSKNTVHVYDISVSEVSNKGLNVTWNFSGNKPEGGWRVLYVIDGGADKPMLVNCAESSAQLPWVPGSHYTISIVQADGSTVLKGETTFDTAQAEAFSGYWLTADSLDFRTCMPTDAQIVNQDTVTFTDSFAPGTKASILMHTAAIYQNGYEEINNLYVIRDANGAVVSITNPIRLWADMLEGGFGLINLPAVPSVVGTYTVDIFFNGMFVASVPFTVA